MRWQCYRYTDIDMEPWKLSPSVIHWKNLQENKLAKESISTMCGMMGRKRATLGWSDLNSGLHSTTELPCEFRWVTNCLRASVASSEKWNWSWLQTRVTGSSCTDSEIRATSTDKDTEQSAKRTIIIIRNFCYIIVNSKSQIIRRNYQ